MFCNSKKEFYVRFDNPEKQHYWTDIEDLIDRDDVHEPYDKRIY